MTKNVPLHTLKFRNFGPTKDDLAALYVCLLWQGYGVSSKVIKVTLVSRIEDHVRLFFFHTFSPVCMSYLDLYV